LENTNQQIVKIFGSLTADINIIIFCYMQLHLNKIVTNMRGVSTPSGEGEHRLLDIRERMATR
jgi:hypothetical protein